MVLIRANKKQESTLE